MKEEITKGFKGECVPLVSGAREKVLCGFEPVHHIGFKQLKPSFNGSLIFQRSHANSVGSAEISLALFLKVFVAIKRSLSARWLLSTLPLCLGVLGLIVL